MLGGIFLMEKTMNKHQKLIDAVIEQIKTDVRVKDMTAIEELLCELPIEKLIGFLPEWRDTNEHTKI